MLGVEGRQTGASRKRNRLLAQEVIRILEGVACTVYSASITKVNIHHQMAQKTTMPLLLQALVHHFAVECDRSREIGLMVVDRSSPKLDAHASHCVASYVTPRGLPLHPTVYYADSMTSQAVQVADLISGARRRSLEGDTRMQVLDDSFAAVRRGAFHTARTHTGRRWTNRIAVF